MVTKSHPMNGGHGKYSYAKNSSLQRDRMISLHEVMEMAIKANVDIEYILCGSTTFRIADFGCSIGPNTFFSSETIIQLLEEMYYSCNPHCSTKLEFQVFFNDQISNDFNTLFKSIPSERKYFAAGVPGSFHNRLFPLSSIHVAFSFYSLQWLSKAPKGLQIKGSPAWNRGRIYYTGASDAVLKAYEKQFAEDVERFLKARADEIVKGGGGGVIVIVTPGVRDGPIPNEFSLIFTFIGSILMDMVNEGIIDEDQIDSFNYPNMYPSVKQMIGLVEKNGCFSIVKMELRNTTGFTDIDQAIMITRAASEGTLTSHFGGRVVDEIFERVTCRKTELSCMLRSSGPEFAVQLFSVLKRN